MLLFIHNTFIHFHTAKQTTFMPNLSYLIFFFFTTHFLFLFRCSIFAILNIFLTLHHSQLHSDKCSRNASFCPVNTFSYHGNRFHVEFVVFHCLTLEIRLTFLHLLQTIPQISISSSFFFASSYYRSIFHLYLANMYQSLCSKAQVVSCSRSCEMFPILKSRLVLTLLITTNSFSLEKIIPENYFPPLSISGFLFSLSPLYKKPKNIKM
jgi:hypothetical protein